jgi:hypothetical protein
MRHAENFFFFTAEHAETAETHAAHDNVFVSERLLFDLNK